MGYGSSPQREVCQTQVFLILISCIAPSRSLVRNGHVGPEFERFGQFKDHRPGEEVMPPFWRAPVAFERTISFSKSASHRDDSLPMPQRKLPRWKPHRTAFVRRGVRPGDWASSHRAAGDRESRRGSAGGTGPLSTRICRTIHQAQHRISFLGNTLRELRL